MKHGMGTHVSGLQLCTDMDKRALFLSPAPMVLVLFNAGPLDISWAKNSEQVISIIEMFYPAQVRAGIGHLLQSHNVGHIFTCVCACTQTAGDALSKVLTGEYNPAGRLPNTWPASLEQVLGWGMAFDRWLSPSLPCFYVESCMKLVNVCLLLLLYL